MAKAVKKKAVKKKSTYPGKKRGPKSKAEKLKEQPLGISAESTEQENIPTDPVENTMPHRQVAETNELIDQNRSIIDEISDLNAVCFIITNMAPARRKRAIPFLKNWLKEIYPEE